MKISKIVILLPIALAIGLIALFSANQFEVPVLEQNIDDEQLYRNDQKDLIKRSGNAEGLSVISYYDYHDIEEIEEDIRTLGEVESLLFCDITGSIGCGMLFVSEDDNLAGKLEERVDELKDLLNNDMIPFKPDTDSSVIKIYGAEVRGSAKTAIDWWDDRNDSIRFVQFIEDGRNSIRSAYKPDQELYKSTIVPSKFVVFILGLYAELK